MGKRSDHKKRRRFVIRLAVSVESLLRLAVKYKLPPLEHSLPMRPVLIFWHLRQLANGTAIEDLIIDLTDTPSPQPANDEATTAPSNDEALTAPSNDEATTAPSNDEALPVPSNDEGHTPTRTAAHVWSGHAKRSVGWSSPWIEQAGGWSSSGTGSWSGCVPWRSKDAEVIAGGVLLVAVVDYGVLGMRLMHGPGRNRGDWIRRRGSDPGPIVAIVDPAGLQFIWESGPYLAGGASGALYEWLGIKAWQSFPVQVKYAIKAETHAKLHVYMPAPNYRHRGTAAVIHVAGPDFRPRPDITREEAVGVLAKAYCNVLEEFNRSGLKSLRLLPISGGILSGHLKAELPSLTAEAVQSGFRRLSLPVQTSLKAATFQMCIYDENEYHSFSDAFENECFI